MALSGPAILVLTARALPLARRIAGLLPGAEVHGLARRVAGADVPFADVVEQLRALFAAGRPIIAIAAIGIVVRALAPLLSGKGSEPPVIAVAADGSAVVPLLGGHRGGNTLARRIAAALGARAAITTAGDLAFGLALDEPPAGWRVANPATAKAVMAAELAGEAIALDAEVGDAAWLRAAGIGAGAGTHRVRVTARADPGDTRTLVLHPPVLALGVGCERDAEAEELITLALDTLARAGLAAGAVACVASLDLKADEPAVHALSTRLGVPARFFPAAALAAEEPRLATPSAAVRHAVGVAGVAEAAALAAAGAGGRLVVPKAKSARATCAVALAPGGIDGLHVGHPRGRLAIVGLGPGGEMWMSGEARAELATATDLVGYHRYLDLAAEAAGAAARRHGFALGAEEARADHALDLAAAGRQVALLSSGDAGIYAMAAVVFERLERSDRAEWNRIAITVAPGISALQAAAARVGAPLGHDFCAISLSDRLTPAAVIEARLRAAAEGDFVVALYNPASRSRRDLLVRAREILLQARAPTTPVVIARNLGRAGESVRHLTLGALQADDADMLSLVLVGSRATRRVTQGRSTWVYTPRGYGDRKVPPE